MPTRREAMAGVFTALLAGAAGAQEAQDKQPRVGYVNVFAVKQNTRIYQQATQELEKLDQQHRMISQRAKRFRMLTGKEAERAVELDAKLPNLTPEEQAEYERLKNLDLTRSQEQAQLMRLSKLTPEQEQRFKELLDISRTRTKELEELGKKLDEEWAQARKKWNDSATSAFIGALRDVQKELNLEIILQSHIRVYVPDPTGQGLMADYENVVLLGGTNVTDRVIQVMNEKYASAPAASAGTPPAGEQPPPPPGAEG